MGRKVVIYTRVSTEDQKENGFSLQEQYSRILSYCQKMGYERAGHYEDNHSAKTFNRPKFKEFLNDVKTKKVNSDLLIVTKIDRFSRDAMETVLMVKKLDSFGIKVFSLMDNCELDFNNAASFFPLFLQAGMAQHENLLRGENTKRGMRHAQSIGRWMGKAPIGYKIDKVSKKLIPVNETAQLIKESFDLMSKCIYSAEEVRREMYKKGLKVTKNGFLNILKNPVYIGKILMKAWKDEPDQIVDGIHLAIIEDHIYNVVNDFMAGRRNKISINSTRNELLILRGYLECNKCGKKLTGSASKSRNETRHYYYHCQSPCKERFRADLANSYFETYLATFQIQKEVLNLYYKVLNDVFKTDDVKRLNEKKVVEAAIEVNENRVKTLNMKLLDGEIDKTIYNEIKMELKKNEDELLLKHTQLGDNNSSLRDYLKFSFSIINGLKQYYTSSSIEIKQKLIGSIFPEKLIYSDNNYRTTKMNSVMSLLTNNTKALEMSENQKTDGRVGFIDLAPSPGLEPGTP
jgi:site-specific DNA recombinase